MRQLVPTFLFGDQRIATATRGRSRYKHTFGGPPDRAGASRGDCNGILIHLLHRLDLTDPAIPIAIPGIRWLPLYYCFDFRVNVLGYRLISDESLVTFIPSDDPNVTDHESFPGDDYPEVFPKCGIRIADFGYDPTNLEDAWTWAGIFGVGQLSKRNLAAARKRVTRESIAFGFTAPETDADFERAFSNPFAQGKPHDPCMNPGCPNSRRKGQLDTIALVPAEPIRGVQTFGRWGGGVQLIVQMCSRCFTIRVSNQCT